MSTYNILLTCILIIFVFLLITMVSFKNIFDNYFKKQDKNYFISIFIVIGAILIILSFLTPYYFTNTEIGNTIKFTSKTGYTGDTLGGIMNPFIAIAGVIFTFLAFYMQKKANDDIKEQFKIQQFENQFFEMLNLYRLNVDEVNIGKIKGRKCFARMLDEFKFIYFETEYFFRDTEIHEIVIHEISYYVFFYGVGNNIKDILYKKYRNLAVDDNINNLIDRLERYKNEHISEGYITFNDNNGNTREYNFKYIPFKGHVSRLGHYFRHLFQTVSYIVDSKILDNDKKYRYIKLLRAQLSNYELVLLYFNGITDMGIDWVEKGYFTDYKFLKNLPHQLINYSVNPVDFFEEKEINTDEIFDF